MGKVYRRVGPAFINPNSSEVVDAIVSTVEVRDSMVRGSILRSGIIRMLGYAAVSGILPLMTLCRRTSVLAFAPLGGYHQNRERLCKSIPVIALARSQPDSDGRRLDWNTMPFVNLPSSIAIGFGLLGPLVFPMS